MGWESANYDLSNPREDCFNPSFLLDGLEIIFVLGNVRQQSRFNPSFLLDGLGILLDGIAQSLQFCFNPSFLLDGLGIHFLQCIHQEGLEFQS